MTEGRQISQFVFKVLHSLMISNMRSFQSPVKKVKETTNAMLSKANVFATRAGKKIDFIEMKTELMSNQHAKGRQLWSLSSNVSFIRSG